MRIPDVFIVGAPKCGTSSLATYLDAHPDIYMSPIKEPHYFYPGSDRFRQVSTEGAYQQLFAGAAPDQLCCEASTCYLYSDSALEAVLAANPKSKIIAMVRDPVEMVISFHRQQVFTFQENVADFSRALALADERRQGRAIPKTCSAPELLDYPMVGQLGTHLKRLARLVAPERLHIILFDDLCADPAATYRETLRFIGFKPLELRDFKVVNARKTHRWPWLSRLLIAPPFPINLAKEAVRTALGYRSKSLGHRIYGRLSRPPEQASVPLKVRAQLCEAFRPETRKLEGLLGRDLSHWCNV